MALTDLHSTRILLLKPIPVLGKGPRQLDRLRFRSAGGSDYGNPLNGTRNTSRATCGWAFVSKEAARRDYGVVLDDEGSMLIAETRKERERRSDLAAVPFPTPTTGLGGNDQVS
jgi:hypothetical protein